jgi:flap endonuclease-1
MGTAIGDLIERENIDLEDLTGKTLAIDAHNILYQFLTTIRGPDGRPLMDANGDVTSHLAGLLYRTSNFLEAGIKPIFVFDGKPHPLKEATLKKRHEIRTQAKEDMEKAIESGDFEKARLMSSRAVSLDRKMIEQAQEAMRALGFPVVQGKEEGEAQATQLVRAGLAYAAGTQDYDTLLFGCPRIVRNLGVTGKRKLPYRNAYIDIHMELIELQKELQRLQLSREQLIWIGMLIGTDFNEKIPNVGPKKAFKAVQGKKDFDEVLDGLKQKVEYDWEEVEEMFLHPTVHEIEKIPQTKLDREAALHFYVDKHGFDVTRVTNALNKIEKKPQDEKQRTLGSWG